MRNKCRMQVFGDLNAIKHSLEGAETSQAGSPPGLQL